MCNTGHNTEMLHKEVTHVKHNQSSVTPDLTHCVILLCTISLKADRWLEVRCPSGKKANADGWVDIGGDGVGAGAAVTREKAM